MFEMSKCFTAITFVFAIHVFNIHYFLCNAMYLTKDLDLVDYQGRVTVCGDNQSTENNVCACTPGYYLVGDTCTPCTEGFYKNDIGNHACYNCPDHTTSFTGSDELADCLCNVGY